MVGFPVSRVEKIGYVRRLLEQEQKELPPEKGNTEAPAPTTAKAPALSADRHNYRITDDALGVGGAKEKFRNNMAAVSLLHELEIESRLLSAMLSGSKPKKLPTPQDGSRMLPLEKPRRSRASYIALMTTGGV